MESQISFSKAVEGYLLAAHARKLSEFTIKDYLNTYRKFLDFFVDDPPIESITSHDVENFLAAQSVSKKTLVNYHISLSALWTWALAEGLVSGHILRNVKRAKPEKKAVKPYSEVDVREMLSSLTHTKFYSRPGKDESRHKLMHAERNRAIILLLLDTGIRSSELCELKIHQVDVRNRRITVMGKGTKERTIPFSAPTGQAIWRYLAQRKDDTIDERLFTSKSGRPMNRDQLLKTLKRIGERGGIPDVTVHRFRHTFAINYLRNGGDPYSLQVMLGHSTMEMVKTYLALSQADLEKNHRQASPVANWRL